MASLAFSLPLKAGKTEEWRDWIRELLGPRRSEFEAFRRQSGLNIQRAYLQHTPQGDQVIIYLEGHDLQRVFHELQMSPEPFAAWLRQKAEDLYGFDLTQSTPESLSSLVYDESNLDEDASRGYIHEKVELAASLPNNEIPAQDAESDHIRKEMERYGMTSP